MALQRSEWIHRAAALADCKRAPAALQPHTPQTVEALRRHRWGRGPFSCRGLTAIEGEGWGKEMSLGSGGSAYAALWLAGQGADALDPKIADSGG